MSSKCNCTFIQQKLTWRDKVVLWDETKLQAWVKDVEVAQRQELGERDSYTNHSSYLLSAYQNLSRIELEALSYCGVIWQFSDSFQLQRQYLASDIRILTYFPSYCHFHPAPGFVPPLHLKLVLAISHTASLRQFMIACQQVRLHSDDILSTNLVLTLKSGSGIQKHRQAVYFHLRAHTL